MLHSAPHPDLITDLSDSRLRTGLGVYGEFELPRGTGRRSMAVVHRSAIDSHLAFKLSALHSAYATLHSLLTKTLSVFGLSAPLKQPPGENSRWCGNRLCSVSADGEPGPGRMSP